MPDFHTGAIFADAGLTYKVRGIPNDQIMIMKS
jgi:hypothetical protein